MMRSKIKECMGQRANHGEQTRQAHGKKNMILTQRFEMNESDRSLTPIDVAMCQLFEGDTAQHLPDPSYATTGGNMVTQ